MQNHIQALYILIQICYRYVSSILLLQCRQSQYVYLHVIYMFITFSTPPKDKLSSKRQLRKIKVYRMKKKKKLKKYCATRWVERHESVSTYIDLQAAVIEALETISNNWKDSTTTSGAFQLLRAIKTTEFQIAINVLHSVHALTLSLSRALQTENQDLTTAVKLADAAKEELQQNRIDATTNFKQIFQKSETICHEFDIEIAKPRIASRQTQRCNVRADNVEDYYRISMYIPYLDLFINHLEDRFLKHRTILSNFNCLFPQKTPTLNEDACTALFEQYSSILHDTSSTIWLSEVKLWRRRIGSENVTNALNALDICSVDAFQNVHKILCVLAVLPVTTASNERSFSTLRRIKTYLRATMSETRLNGLALLNIHRDVAIKADDVLNEFFAMPRRLNLLK